MTERTIEILKAAGVEDVFTDKINAGERFSREDLINHPLAGEIHAAMIEWLNGYTGDFPFLMDVKHQVWERVNASYDYPSLLDQMSVGQAKGVANCVLAELKKARRPAATTNDRVTEAGMYRHEGEIYKVQVAVHGSGNLYAKHLIVGENGEVHFEYEAGAIRRLTPADRMTLDEARAFGALYGTCCVCGRTLTDEVSIAHGIGPICEGRV